ncbi:hypothetical protein D920_00212, partial [Enterococcus faecalis 13-SD-W-01]
MKQYQIKLKIWFAIAMLLGSFLSQTGIAVATTIDNTAGRKNTLLNGETSNSEDREKVEAFLKEHKLIQGEDGKFYTTGKSNYINSPFNFDSSLKSRNGNSIVYVDPNAHIANIDIRLSNGNREYGWYGKRVNGDIAMCIEQGVALNVGANGGYTAILQNTDLMKRLSLIKYYGIIVPGHTLQRELMTQMLSWEQQGLTPTSVSGVFSMSDYQAFKTTVMTEVNKFYMTPSFSGQTVTLKVGESVTLTDTTGAFSNYRNTPGVNTARVSVSKSGNSLTITARSDSNESGILRFLYDIDSSYQGVPVIFEHPYTQNVMLGFVNDPSFFSINVNVQKNGNARIRKVDETTKQPLTGA